MRSNAVRTHSRPKPAPRAAANAALTLPLALASELMTPHPISIRGHATVPEALALLSDYAISAVPVVNREGHPIGVLSRTDLVRFERERIEFLERNPVTFDGRELTLPTGEMLDTGFQVEAGASARVDEVMTPKVYSVLPDTPVRDVVRMMVDKHVHQVLVVEPSGVLVGMIGTMDLLRRLIA